ncbi:MULTISPECIES: flavin reductase family protein [unclassified Aeromicrobium]|uniref:flavin reductase family protein n=1 Tax=unclassified Aeromicrobium TaxID=2633570 RepID=UPI00396B1A12
MSAAAHDGVPAPAESGPELERAFRSAMGNVATGVAVVTTLADGRPHGTTVSAFQSLSMEPPMMLFSLGNRSVLLERLRVGARVGVNVLAAHHDQVALRFSRSGGDKFADLAWRLEDGAPALPDRHAWVSLRVASLVPGGDHTVVLGDVLTASAASGAPLTYWQRTFGTHHSF